MRARIALLLCLVLAVGVHADVETTAIPVTSAGAGTFNGGTVTGSTTFTGQSEFSGQTNISGPDATTNVEIGSTANDANAGTGGTSVVIGNAATNSGNGANNVLIGTGATCTNGAGLVAIGRNATCIAGAANAVMIGNSAAAGGNGVAIGSSASTGGGGGIAIGQSATAGANEFVAGDDGVASAAMTNVYFGEGKADTTATSYTINGTGGSGADNAGAAINIAGGAPTGTGRGGNVILQAAPSGATSSTPQALENRHYIVAQRFALTDNTIATFSTHTLGDDTVGGGTISYCVVSRDATTTASECGEVDYAGADVTAGAGGEVCPNPTKQGTPLQVLSGATLSVTFAGSTGTDLCNIRVTADTNIAAPVALYLVWNASNPGGRTLTPQ